MIWARRVEDNSTVAIKRVLGDSELEISLFLSSPEMKKFPTNYSIPILDHFDDGEVVHFIAMPFLRPYDDPPFFAVCEVVDFIYQTLEVRAPSFR